jgi:hypothetical protein
MAEHPRPLCSENKDDLILDVIRRFFAELIDIATAMSNWDTAGSAAALEGELRVTGRLRTRRAARPVTARRSAPDPHRATTPAGDLQRPALGHPPATAFARLRPRPGPSDRYAPSRGQRQNNRISR